MQHIADAVSLSRWSTQRAARSCGRRWEGAHFLGLSWLLPVVPVLPVLLMLLSHSFFFLVKVEYAESCKELWEAVGEDFQVVSPCFSTARPE